MAIEGNLKDMHLAEIIQFTCRNKDVARVTVNNGAVQGAIYFADGQVVHAVCDTEMGEQAAYQLLGWRDGHFIIEKDIVTPSRTIDISPRNLLLRGMKYLDESRAQGKRQPKPVKEVTYNPEIKGVLQGLADGLESFTAVYLFTNNGDTLAALEPTQEYTLAGSLSSMAAMLKNVSHALALLQAGALEEIITLTQQHLYIVRPIGQGQRHIWLLLKPDGNLGAARIHLLDKENTLLNYLDSSSGEPVNKILQL